MSAFKANNSCCQKFRQFESHLLFQFNMRIKRIDLFARSINKHNSVGWRIQVRVFHLEKVSVKYDLRIVSSSEDKVLISCGVGFWASFHDKEILESDLPSNISSGWITNFSWLTISVDFLKFFIRVLPCIWFWWISNYPQVAPYRDWAWIWFSRKEPDIFIASGTTGSRLESAFVFLFVGSSATG